MAGLALPLALGLIFLTGFVAGTDPFGVIFLPSVVLLIVVWLAALWPVHRWKSVAVVLALFAGFAVGSIIEVIVVVATLSIFFDGPHGFLFIPLWAIVSGAMAYGVWRARRRSRYDYSGRPRIRPAISEEPSAPREDLPYERDFPEARKPRTAREPRDDATDAS